MSKPIILTGDRPTGKLHIGHYVEVCEIVFYYKMKENMNYLYF